MLKNNNLKALAFALCATTMAGLYASPVFAATGDESKLVTPGTEKKVAVEVKQEALKTIVEVSADKTIIEKDVAVKGGLDLAEGLNVNNRFTVDAKGSIAGIYDGGGIINANKTGFELYDSRNVSIAGNNTSLDMTKDMATITVGSEEKVVATDKALTLNDGNAEIKLNGSNDGGAGIEITDGASSIVVNSTAGTTVTGDISLKDNLHVAGDTVMDGTLGVTGDASLKNTVVDGTLGVTGDAGLKNTVVDGTLGVTGDAGLKNTVVDGTLGVTGDAGLKNTVVDGTLGVTGDAGLKNTVVDGTLGVTGDAGLKNTVVDGTLDVTGKAGLKNTVVDGTLDVTGKAGLKDTVVDGTLGVTGDASLKDTVVDGTLNVKDNADFDKNINVDGNAVIDGTLSAANGNFTVDADGNTDVKGTLDVTGKATLENDLQVNGNTVMDGTLNVKGNADFDANVNVDGTLDVTGKATLKNDLQVKGNTVMDGTLTVAKDADLQANLHVGQNAVVDESLKVAGDSFTADGEKVKINLQDTDEGYQYNSEVNAEGEIKLMQDSDKNTNVSVETAQENMTSMKDAAGNGYKSEVKADEVETTINDADGSFAVQGMDAEGYGGHVENKAGNKAGHYVNVDEIAGYVDDGRGNVANQGMDAEGYGGYVQDKAGNEAGHYVNADMIGSYVEAGDSFTGVLHNAEDGLAVYDENTVVDEDGAPIGATNVTGTNVSIADQENAGERVELSDLGQIDNVDSELAYEMDNRMYHGDSLEAGVAHNAVNAINAEAQIRRREIDRLDTKIESVGAMSAAIANLRTMGYDPAAPSEFSMSVGHYRGETAMAAGFFHYPNKDFMVSMSVSYGHDELMGGVGATWKFGHRTPDEIARIERERQAEKAMVAAEKAAEAEEAERVAAQAARHQAMLEAEA